jgi:two-component system NarL family sensor kinase
MLKDESKIYTAVITTFAMFILVAFGLILLVVVYNRRKKKHMEEKILMKLTFEAEIAKAQLEVQEQTMQTIGADLHDNIGQLLSLTSLTLNSIELDNPAKARQKIDDSIGLTLRSIKEMRLLGHLLQGDQLVAIGLSEAIRQEIAWMERSGRYEIIYITTDEIPAINNPDKDLIIFRILQEMFNNIIKHAAATRISVKLDYGEGALKLCVNDNGIGFVADGQPLAQHGMGLQNIQKRAGIIGGEAAIVSTIGEGTQITIFIPYP